MNRRGEVDKLKPEYRLALARDGYVLVKCGLAAFNSMASRSSAELVAYLLIPKCERRRIDGTRNVPKVARRSAM